MKKAPWIFALWLVLGGLSCLLAAVAHDELIESAGAWALIGLPTLAVWLTARSTVALPGSRLVRVGLWVITFAAWLALLLLLEGRAEAHPADRRSIFAAFGCAGLAALLLPIKLGFPSRRLLGEASAAAALLALAGGLFLWRYDAGTHAIAARAEARWSEIGLPMSEFEKTLSASSENEGSVVVRKVLRELVNSRFYKNGTRAADLEPAGQPSKIGDELVMEALSLLSAERPPADELDLSSESVTAFEPMAEALDADYRRILAAEPAGWACDPRDGFFMNSPDFLGIRKFAQIAAADANRRCSIGDEEGAARAVAAGLKVRDGLRKNPTLVSMMIAVAVDCLFVSKQVRLPAPAGDLPLIARDAASQRAELLEKLRMEGWLRLKTARQVESNQPVTDETFQRTAGILPDWAARIVNQKRLSRELSISALNGAEHAAIQKSPETLTLPDLGASRHAAVSKAIPSELEINGLRALMRIHATLLLHEQMELIRDARVRFAAGLPVESRDSVVLPGVRWELTGDAEKATVATRLTGAPEWIVKNEVTGKGFWLLPLDGSVAWQFRQPPRTAGRD